MGGVDPKHLRPDSEWVNQGYYPVYCIICGSAFTHFVSEPFCGHVGKLLTVSEFKAWRGDPPIWTPAKESKR